MKEAPQDVHIKTEKEVMQGDVYDKDKQSSKATRVVLPRVSLYRGGTAE